MKKFWTLIVAAAFVLAGCGGSDESAPTVIEEPETTVVETQEPTVEPTEEPEGAPGTRDNPLALGTSVALGEYELAVTKIDTDADDKVLEENEFNEPSEFGRYVIVRLEGTFVGGESDEGMPAFDLVVTIVGSDSKQYKSHESMAIPPDDLYDEKTLEPGGEFAGNMIISMPSEAIEGATLFVQPLFDFSDERAFWTIQ